MKKCLSEKLKVKSVTKKIAIKDKGWSRSLKVVDRKNEKMKSRDKR